MVQESLKQPKEGELLGQLIGEWIVGIAMKSPDGKVVAGCGQMTAVETSSGINGEVNIQIDDYEDYYQNDLWSFDPQKGEVHLFSTTSDGEIRDHVGKWKDDTTLELSWRGTYEDQDQEERIIAKWVTKNQIELRESNYKQGKLLLQTDYVFKRREA
jgi:hypothetical protein